MYQSSCSSREETEVWLHSILRSLHSDLQCVSIRCIITITPPLICHLLSLDVSHSMLVLPFYIYFHQLPMLSIVKTRGSFENI